MAGKKTTNVPGLRITAGRDGFRRAGRVWQGTTDVPVAELSEAQIAMLKAEPKLRVEEIDIEAEG